MKTLKFFKWNGAFWMLSAIIYTISGVGWWAPVSGDYNDARGPLLVLIHFMSMCGGLIAVVNEEKNDPFH